MRMPWRASRPAPAAEFVIHPYRRAAEAPSQVRARRWVYAATITFCLVYGLTFAFLAPFLMAFFVVPIAILAIITIWALPDLQRAPTRSLEFLFFTFLICLVMWPNYLAIALPGLPWITLIRLSGIPMTFVLLICVSTSAQFRTKVAEALKEAPLIWQSLVLFVLLQVVSIAFSASKADSIQKFAIDQVYWTAMFFCSCYVFQKSGRIELWSGLLWAMTLPIGLIGILENRMHHVIWAGHIPSFLQIEDPNIAMILHGIKRAFTDIYRVQATFSTSLGLSEYLALTMPFVIHYMVGPYSNRIKGLAAVSIPFILYIILISGSRLGALGFGMSCLLYLFAWAFLRWRRERSGLLAPAILLSYPAIFASALAASFFVGKLRKAVWGAGAAQGSTDARITQVKMGIPLILKHPWGYGIGQGASTLDFHNPGGILTIDTYYLLIALDYGVLGFILYYGMIMTPIYYASKITIQERIRSRETSFLIPIAIALLNFLIIKSIFSQADNHPLIFMMMGMVTAICLRIRQEEAAARTGGLKAPEARKPER